MSEVRTPAGLVVDSSAAEKVMKRVAWLAEYAKKLHHFSAFANKDLDVNVILQCRNCGEPIQWRIQTATGHTEGWCSCARREFIDS